MLRFDLKLIPLEEAKNEADAKIITESNTKAEAACAHIKKLVGHKKCRKHPSSINKIRITAHKGADPKAEFVVYCCPEFVKTIK
ncbi:MAG: hypothetical protein IT236_15905 [Bacteroidia bacterium]|nr:hypothetical protein [Bacteroidia bacterium]